MERRKTSASKPSLLPVDYLRMVTDIFTSHFDAGLKALSQYVSHPYFEARGEVHANEIVLAVSLSGQGQLAATTVYASSDFDPKASAPTAQEILSACVDAAGSVFGSLLEANKPDVLAQLGEQPLSALENVPFHWTAIESNHRQVFIKIDKANLQMDAMADDWLMKNDPEYKVNEEKTEKEVEKLFITGPSTKNTRGNSSGTTH